MPHDQRLEKVITSSHQEAFARRGIVKLDKFVPDDVTTPLRGDLHDALAEAGVSKDGRWIGKRLDGFGDVAIQSKLMKARLKPLMNERSLLPEPLSETLAAMAEALIGGQALNAERERPQLLFTPPNATEWSVPNRIWHVDAPRLGSVGCPGIQMFTFIDTVEPGGGGTLAVAGSHQYVNECGKVRSKQVIRALRQEPWFKALFAEPHGPEILESIGRKGDREVQVVEMTGKPGDVYLMDLRVIHTLGWNASDRPRLMATQRYFLHGLEL